MCFPVYGYYYAAACICLVVLEGLAYFVRVFLIPREYVPVTACDLSTPGRGVTGTLKGVAFE